MDRKRHHKVESLPLKIAIIGGGFAGTALAHACYSLTSTPLDISLFEKSGDFGTGKAYCTPFAHHLLNVRAMDMSAYEAHPKDFVEWLSTNKKLINDDTLSLDEQFVPRHWYGLYLKNLLHHIQKDRHSDVRLNLEPKEVIDIIPRGNQLSIVLSDQEQKIVDKVILALGNNPPAHFSFPISDINVLHNPWDYEAPLNVAKNDNVCIVGTGLSMIDAVLTLHHAQHRGLIYAVSRHGLLPLPHANRPVDPNISLSFHQIPSSLREITHYLRDMSDQHTETGGDWRTIINSLRHHIPKLWMQSTLADRKCFLRHVLPYWNIHRHRVHDKISQLLTELRHHGQLKIIAGKMVEARSDKTIIQLRHSQQMKEIHIQWLINCMGPNLNFASKAQGLIKKLQERGLASFDALQLGLSVSSEGALQLANGEISSKLYAVGSLRKGMSWEVGAVPEIRKQCFDLARHMLAIP